MKLSHLTVGLAMLLSAGAAGAAPKLTGEARVAEIVAGRTAGAPISCINPRDIRSTDLIQDVGVVYYMRGGTILVNRPQPPFTTGFDDYMVTRTFSSQLCRIDIVQLVDRNSQIGRGSFSLGDFIPYPKPPKAPRG